MLHVVVSRHSPESCAYRSKALEEASRAAFGRLQELAAAQGGTLIGAYVNTAAHTTFVIADAPNAHVLNELLEDSGMVAWGTSDIYAVTRFEEQLSKVAQRQETAVA